MPRLQQLWLSGSRVSLVVLVLGLSCSSLVALRHVESSLVRDGIHVVGVIFTTGPPGKSQITSDFMDFLHCFLSINFINFYSSNKKLSYFK